MSEDLEPQKILHVEIFSDHLDHPVVVRLHDVFDDDCSQFKPGTLSGCTPVAFEVLVIKPAELILGNNFERITHRFLLM
jgi:hypothetical protein